MSGAPGPGRIHSIDIVRGLAVVLMALDHVRDYWTPTAFSALDVAHTTPAWFMTRWITHFCAPAFILLSGVSARFQLARLQATGQRDKAALSRYLLQRGLWLVLLEVVVVNVSWTAALPADYLWLQVIWVIGLSMIVCAGAIWLPPLPLFAVAMAMVAGHDLLNDVQPAAQWAWLWHVLHQRGGFEIFDSGYEIFIAYPLLPWPGVMLLGYLLGDLYLRKPESMARRSAWLGGGALAAFVVLRAWIHYGDPTPFAPQATPLLSALAFLNVSKYPASLQFVCVTLGLCLLMLALAQRYRFAGADVLAVFGRVPLFFYLLHIPLINLSAQLWTALQYGEAVNLLTADTQHWPPGYEPALWRAYAVWAVFLIVMYFIYNSYWRWRSAPRPSALQTPGVRA